MPTYILDVLDHPFDILNKSNTRIPRRFQPAKLLSCSTYLLPTDFKWEVEGEARAELFA